MSDVVTEEMVHDAFDYLLNSVDDCSRAKAAFSEMETMTKIKIAEFMKEASMFQKMSIGEQEREARADPRLKEHIKSTAHAEFLDHQHKLRRKNCEIVIMAWQTQCADRRAMEKIK